MLLHGAHFGDPGAPGEVQLEGTDYTVLRWQAVPAGGWAIDEGIELWDMEMF